MKNWQTVFLKIIIFLCFIPVLLFNFYLFPKMIHELLSVDIVHNYYLIVVICSFYLMLVPFLLILRNIYKIILNIETNKYYSEETAYHYQMITKFSFIITFLFVVDLPFVYLFVEIEDAPGILFMALIITGAAFTFGVFSSVLKSLLKERKEDDF